MKLLSHQYLVVNSGRMIHDAGYRREKISKNGMQNKKINETKELIKEEMKRSQELLEKQGEILEKLSEQHITMINLLKSP